MDTGHPIHKSLTEMRWAGKTFHDVDNVDPIMIYDEEGKRVWSESWGHARVSSLFNSTTKRDEMVLKGDIVERDQIQRGGEHSDGI